MELLEKYIRKIHKPKDWDHFVAYMEHFVECDECEDYNCGCCCYTCSEAPWFD